MVYSERSALTEKIREWMERNGCRFNEAIVFNAVTAMDAMGFLEAARTFVHATEHLERLVSMGCPCNGDDERMNCNSCGAEMHPEPKPHEPYCIWKQAEDFLDQLNIPTAADAPSR